MGVILLVENLSILLKLINVYINYERIQLFIQKWSSARLKSYRRTIVQQ